MGLRGGSSLCPSARRRSSLPGLARSPLHRQELGTASAGGGRRTGEAWGQLESSQQLEELLKGRLMGHSEETRRPQPVMLQKAPVPCRGFAWAGSQR